jgi:hypothetical protein
MIFAVHQNAFRALQATPYAYTARTSSHSVLMNTRRAQVIVLSPAHKPFILASINHENHLSSHLSAQECRLLHARHGGMLPFREIVRDFDLLYRGRSLSEAAIMVDVGIHHGRDVAWHLELMLRHAGLHDVPRGRDEEGIDAVSARVVHRVPRLAWYRRIRARRGNWCGEI